MNSEAPSTTQTRRRRDSQGTREALLRAATELFIERGYDHATVRDIGERAGVDAAMIARYFGGKAQLYIAVLHEEMGEQVDSDILDPVRAQHLVGRAIARGPSPIYQVAFRPHDDPKAQAASRTELHERIIAPLVRRLLAEGVDRPEERAELIAAAFIGILTARASGAFDRLAHLNTDELTNLIMETLAPR